MKTIPLDQPIGDIKEVSLRRPKAGELRGLMLAKVQLQDTGSLITLLPRITQPSLTEDQLADMDPADFTALANEVTAFFVTKGDLERLTAEAG